MKTRCPVCGAENSLDALIANEDARELLWTLAQVGGDLAKQLVKYLGLFRPEKSSLSGARMAKLLAELRPDILNQCIQRDGRVTKAPPAAWIWALGEVLNARDAGTLKTPLKSHGYLYEVLSNWRGTVQQVVDQPMTQNGSNKMVESLARLESMK
ncbi:hypothetical protein [Snodgrassella communis]|jgi:hypothetical protein|uniref:hypothetical protein n=1 Tax=Snodgrassella communis TaxID=2946699 RepID=UPI000461838A|nr:hypothetical protein [Snodgrassella communis]KDN12587.1 hypothetical protein SALWKB12_1111 [Snodgrassella communis]PIT09943.1 hypothetical protein BGI31_02010 [Snodgrassella communis]PIT10252.1 hypothetical protein BGI29_04710 [Snodgrassella communis]PIT20353.1 hypothetical protein BGI35_08375 [Snodgrassella communis]PIT25506.1 hypothetical protein BGI38_10305 [Snodgrassella communis]